MTTNTVNQNYFNDTSDGYDIELGDSLVIPVGFLVASLSQDGVHFAAGAVKLTLNGTVSSGYYGVSASDGSTIAVGATGSIFSTNTAVYLSNTTLNNQGIISSNGYGVTIHSTQDITLTNSGTIQAVEGGFDAIDFYNGAKVTVNNTGIIQNLDSTGIYALYVEGAGSGQQWINNSGKIVGAISLGYGDDKYDGHAGHHSGGVIDMGYGADTVYGGSDADSIMGGNDNDSIRGGGGKDTMDGGQGADILDYSDKTKSVSLELSGATVVTVTVGGLAEDHVSNFEKVKGGSVADTLIGYSNANSLTGYGGNDLLKGLSGSDILTGGAGADSLYGYGVGNFNDNAKDTFRYASTSESGVTTATEDTIYGQFGGTNGDKIDISAVATGSSASAFTFTTGTFNAPGQVHVTGSNGNYLVSLNTDSDTAAEMSIIVHTSAAHTFSSGDFVL